MATLDEFVCNVVRHPDERPKDLEEDFRYRGGQAIIINPKGEVRAVGLGIFANILECYDKPIDPSESNTLTIVLDSHRNSDIFKEDRVPSMAVIGGIVQWTPSEDTYRKIQDAVQDLHKKYIGLKQALGPKGSDEYVKKIKTAIKKIKDAKSPEKMMQYIFSESSDLGFLISCIPGWASSNWFIELPHEYGEVAEAYQGLRDACRNGNYTMSVPEDMKKNQYLHEISFVQGVPNEKSSVIIVDNAKELKSFSKLGWDERNIIYRGPVNETTSPILEKLKTNNFLICENIRGPAQYRQWIKEHSS